MPPKRVVIDPNAIDPEAKHYRYRPGESVPDSILSFRKSIGRLYETEKVCWLLLGYAAVSFSSRHNLVVVLPFLVDHTTSFIQSNLSQDTIDVLASLARCSL